MEKELPKNWVETELSNLFNLIYGKGLSVNELTEDGYDVYGANGIIGKYSSYTYENSKVIISCRGAASGVIHYTNPKSFMTSNSIVLDEFTNELLNLKYVKYAMIQLDKSSVITGTAQPQITIQLLKNLNFPLAPLSEQNRIVDKLDRLFAQLEGIKSSMEKIPVLLKNFRQQVLTQAVTGKLTEEWRKGKELESGKDFVKRVIERRKKVSSKKVLGLEYIEPAYPYEVDSSWTFAYLQNFGEFTRGKSKHRPRNDKRLFGGNYPFIQTGEVSRSNGLIKNYTNTYSDFGLEQSRLFPKGTLCITIAANIAETGILDFDSCFPDSVVGYLPFENLYTAKFAMFYLNTIQKDLEHFAPATAQKNINLGILFEVPFPVPPYAEQQEIVSCVESLFAKTNTIEEKYRNLKAKIETLPQTILHKAFKGELSEQLESDGDARDLLKEIMDLKSVDKPKKSVSKKYIQPDDEILRIVAEESSSYPTLSAREKKVQRKMLATHIINRSLEDQSFGKTKFEKLLHLVEYHILQRDLNQNYSVQAAGPYDGGFTKTFWDEVLKSKWFALEEKGSLRRIVSGSNQEKSLKDYGYFSDEEKKKINNFIKIFDHNNYEKPEIVSTLYAVWNNRIKKNESITDDLLKEDFLNWDSGKARYKDRLDKTLEWMKENGIVPNGWGKEIKRAKK